MSISCKQATDYISKKEEGKLSITQRYMLWKHMAVCYLCKRFYKQNKQINNCITMHKNIQEEKLTQEMKDSILHVLFYAENKDTEKI